MALLCSSPLWINGHVSYCVLHSYLSKLLPLSLCLISTLKIWISYFYSSLASSKWIRKSETTVVSNSQQYVVVLSPLLARLEVVAILANITLDIYLMIGGEESYELSSTFISAISSTYLLLLVLLNQTCRVSLGVNLQSHSITLYALQWVCLAIIVQAQVVTEAEWDTLYATIMHFTILTTLCLLHWTARRMPIQIDVDNITQFSDLGRNETASLISRLSFSWLNELVWKAFRTTLQVSDLYPLNTNQKSEMVVPNFDTASSRTAPLLWRLWSFFKWTILGQGGWAAVNSVAVFISPALLRAILEHLELSKLMAPTEIWLCVGGLFVAGVAAGAANCQSDWIGRQMSAKVRAVLINEVYNKLLTKRLVRSTTKEHQKSENSEGNTTDGSIFNLMSVDIENVSETSGNLYFVWVTFPVQTALGTLSLYQILGVSGVLGVLVMILLLPLNFVISQRVMAIQGRVLAASDYRIQEANNILNNIRTIKYLALERPLIDKVMKKRQFEMSELRWRCIWWSINMTTFHALPLIVTIFTCFFYTIVWEKLLETSTAFPALVIFGIIRIPLDRFASSITFLMRAHVSLKRIANFLQERDTGKYHQLSQISNSIHVGFDDTTLAWPHGVSEPKSFDEEDIAKDIPLNEMSSIRPFRLENLQIKFRTNALNVVCGPSGSGKSSLLLGLLGELDLIKGHVFLPYNKSQGNLSPDSLIQATAYCPQEPWIMNRSIRSNILMDLHFDSHRYESVLHAVALTPDIAALDHGDETLAGENGSRLSGGQKQRVALARVLYSRCQYVLLDDCLSAVDSRTANNIFVYAIKGPLMHNRTCIFVTHNIPLVVPHCDYVVMLDDGKVTAQGTADELMKLGIIHDNSIKSKSDIQDSSSDSDNNSIGSVYSDSIKSRSSSMSSVDASLLYEGDRSPNDLESKHEYTEKKVEETVSWSIIRTYLVSMGSKWYWAIILLMFGGQQVVALGTNLWIKKWAFEYDKFGKIIKDSLQLQQEYPSVDNQFQEINALYYMAVYVSICISYMLITFIRDIITLFGALQASSKLYEQLLGSIVHAKFLFFDRVPFGHITNRLTKDVEVMDQWLVGFSISALQLIASMAMVIGLISVIIPAFIPVAIIICIAYYFLTVVYINGARDLKRIESVQRSPLYQQFGETLTGCISIRAYAQIPFFTAQNRALIDQINQSYLLQWAAQSWLTFRLDVLSSLISFFTGIFVLWNSKSIHPGSAGLVLTYAATFTENVMWFVQVYSIIQQNLNSVERIVEYTEIEQEIHQPIKRTIYDLPQGWPLRGEVRFSKYSTRYSHELDPVLNEVSFVVSPGERVAIVGRTGAGKSTLALALIRALEAESGRIEIDGIDIASVALEQLRQTITLVPQDPQVFDGTLRDNLDPLHSYNDEEMVSMLRDVCLFDSINPATSTILDQEANTLSRGQRQLLCIARALLRKSRILVLDEATASIDNETDTTVQTGLRSSTSHGTTVITIAHRLLTIADYDKVVVLDSGRVVEQGSVKELLARRGDEAIFRRLCEESGNIEGIERAANGIVKCSVS